MSLIPYLSNLKEYMPEGIRVNPITAGHAKEFHDKLKAKGMATTTIHKRIQFALQFMHDMRSTGRSSMKTRSAK